MKLYLHQPISNSTDQTFTLDKPISGIWKLLLFNMTNNLFNVNDKNNKVYFNDGTNKTATLRSGYYDINELKTELTTQINSVGSGVLTISIDSTTRKYTFNNTVNFYFNFGTNTENSARKLVGMNASDGTNSTSQTSDIPIDLNTYKSVFVKIAQDDQNDVFGVNYFDTSLILNGIGGFGDLYTYTADDNFDQFIKLINTKKLKFSFHDLNNNTIDLNSEYSILLEKQIIN